MAPYGVPRFEAFPAVRYSSKLSLDLVAAPPYDVLSEDDIEALLDKDSFNIVALDVPREQDGPSRYEMAADLLTVWLGEGVLVQDSGPTFTIYRMQFVDEAGVQRKTVGVLGALEVVDEGAGGVLPHERTTPKAKSDRLDLTRATKANLSPVWGLSLAHGLTRLLTQPGEHVGTCVDENGVIHIIERVSDPSRCAAIANAVSASPVVIADGHHRYAISRTYRDEQRAAEGGLRGAAELTLSYVGELVEDQLSVSAIHRLVSNVETADLLAELEKFFELSDAGAVAAGHARLVVDAESLCLVQRGGVGTFLRPRPRAFEGIRDLDSARLEHALAGMPQAELAYQHGVSNIVHAVDAGMAVAGVLLRPVSVREIQRTADEGLLMPPKSTFFSPKLRTGLVLRLLNRR